MILKRTIAVLLLMIGMAVPVAQAVNNCSSEYYAFIATVRSENTRADYFKDFFTMSTCQVNDVLELYDELDAIKDQFKGAASNCEDTSAYKMDYHRILMEVYFIRNVQRRDPGVTREKDAEKIVENKEIILEGLKEEMHQLFVIEEVRVTEPTFEDYFRVWSGKYGDVIGEYARCEEGAWAELTETWTSFVDTIKSLKIDAPDTSGVVPFKDRFTGSVPTKEEMKDMFVNPVRDVIGGYKVIEEDAETAVQENLGPPPTLGDAVQEAKTFDSVLDLLVTNEEEYDVEENAELRMAGYAMLYGQGGAQITSNLQEYIQGVSEVVNGMSTTDLPKMQEAVEKVSDKQCSG
jgi:hypothetical protein